MGVLTGLFERMAATAEKEHNVRCWLWLVALRGGHTVQMTFAPDASLEHVRTLARERYGPLLDRVVPVPCADRLLTAGEAGRVLMGLAVSGAPFAPMQPERWIDRVAWLLGCSPEHLVSSGRVTTGDAAECSEVAPHLAAELIRASGWTPPESGCGAPLAVLESGPADGPMPDWVAAHDEYLAHLRTCHSCIAHRLRSPVHCKAGAVIRARYEALYEQFQPTKS